LARSPLRGGRKATTQFPVGAAQRRPRPVSPTEPPIASSAGTGPRGDRPPPRLSRRAAVGYGGPFLKGANYSGTMEVVPDLPDPAAARMTLEILALRWKGSAWSGGSSWDGTVSSSPGPCAWWPPAPPAMPRSPCPTVGCEGSSSRTARSGGSPSEAATGHRGRVRQERVSAAFEALPTATEPYLPVDRTADVDRAPCRYRNYQGRHPA
jgi:hypothetical protein